MATGERARGGTPVLAIGLGALGVVAVALVGGVYLLNAGSPAPVTTAIVADATAPPTSVALLGAPAATTPAEPSSIATPAPITGTVAPPSRTPAVTHAGHAPPPPSSAAHDTPPPTTTATATPPSTTTTEPEPTVPTESDAARGASDHGRLHIVASPWGQIWIDGRFMGRAPIDASLRPGSHRIGAGFEQPTVTRTVRVRAGVDERVELEVGDP